MACRPSAARASAAGSCRAPGQFGNAQVGLARGLALACPPPGVRQLEQRPGAVGGPGVRGGGRVLPVPDRFLVGQPGGSFPGRGHAVLPGLGRYRIREHEVPGQLGQRDLTAGRPAGLEGLADPPVQAGPFGRGQLVVGVLAEQVVREAVGAGPVPAHHPGPDGRGERAVIPN